MSSQPPKPMSRRGHHGRPRSANDSKNGKGGDTASKTAKDPSVKDKGSETTAKSDAPKPSKPKPQNEGEKLIVRRLPPAMTEAEFLAILGPEWGVGQGKVDWFDYCEGKVSTQPSKMSRPSRAYFHVMRKDDIMPLSDAVRTKTWEDAKGSFNDPALISPPVVEFSLYKKVPSARKRADTRQGTIDQDPEFMAFLAGLANPTQPKDVEAEHDAADKAQTKVTTTPLVEYLKEKKASRARESSSKKGAKDSGSGSKTKGASKDDASSKKKGRGSGKDDKSEKSKEPVKILTKKAAAAASEQTADGSAKNGASGQTNAANSADGGKSRRAGIAAAARILQRDLGLSPGSAHRRARQDAAKADTKAGGAKDGTETTTVSADGDRAASPAPSDAATSQASKANTSKTSGRRNRGGKNSDKAKSGESAAAPTNPPVILKKRQPDSAENSKASAEETNGAQSKGGQASKAAQNNNKSGNKKQGVSPDATRAFVKNVSTSQGVTEATLRQALEMYGDVTSIEVDKRKGFAYVDFTNNEGLSKAISASPVAIGQTSVQVLERKDKSSGGGNNNGNKQQAAANGEANGSAPSGKPEKSGRGRRGRGGGNKNADKGGGDKAQPANGGGG